MRRKTLVTGGAGFIGSHLCNRLLTEGHEVTVLDDLSSGRRARLSPSVHFVRGDIGDARLLNGLAAGADCIFHLAARVSVQECIRDWQGAHKVNLGGTLNVLKAAHEAGNIPVIYASSAAVYGRGAAGLNHEQLPLKPISPYAADKLACEHHARAMAEIRQLPSVGLRFFNVYGPGQDPASPYAGVIAKFLANRLAGRPHSVFGDGRQSRDFVHIDDIVQGLMLAREHLSGSSQAEVFNLCTGVETTLLDLVQDMDAVAEGGDTAVKFLPRRDGDITRSVGCPIAARDRLGFAAQTSLRAGLAQLVQMAVSDTQKPVASGADQPPA